MEQSSQEFYLVRSWIFSPKYIFERSLKVNYNYSGKSKVISYCFSNGVFRVNILEIAEVKKTRFNINYSK